MAAQKPGLSRDQLATFLKTPAQIRRFEVLFQTVDDTVDNVQSVTVAVEGIMNDVQDISEDVVNVSADVATLNVAAGTVELMSLAPRVELGTMASEDVGATGSFTAQSGETVTVVNGIITSIV